MAVSEKNKKVMEFFEELTKVPHCSFKEEKIGDYLLNFAKERNLEAYRDNGGNVYIKKKPTRDKNEPIILQGHMDMVCVKEAGFDFDFDNDALQLYTEDGFLKAKGTSLGADNGIAVAMILAILDDDTIQHSGIEALITTREEVGLLGAAEVEGDRFEAKTLINIDSEEEGIVTVSCCGGVRHLLNFPLKFEPNNYSKTYKINISGLKGGHSGMEINKQRANGIKIMGRVLNLIKGGQLVSINGGEAMNAIAKDVEAVYATNEDISEKISEFEKLIKFEFLHTDQDLKLTAVETDKASNVIKKEISDSVINTIMALPFGIIKMSDVIDGLVQTSTNVGVITTTEDYISIDNSHRSSIESEKVELIKKTNAIAELAGAKTETIGDYPGWEFAENSKIRDLFLKEYKKEYGKEAKISAIHAGLECGILQRQIGKLDMISIGPDMFDVHTPNERLDLESTYRTYELLLNILKEF